jgi:uncharacterized protein (DUF2267 family)
MQTVTFELPDELADILKDLPEKEKTKFSADVRYLIQSLAKQKEPSALDVIHKMQDKVASLNLSQKEIDELIEESMT